MALPKSMRLLAFVCLGIFFYLLFLIFSAPVDLQPPSTGKLDKMTKDPNLERALLGVLRINRVANYLSYWRTAGTPAKSSWK
jgi:hypothetical protein